jgi:hypothetical protein
MKSDDRKFRYKINHYVRFTMNTQAEWEIEQSRIACEKRLCFNYNLFSLSKSWHIIFVVRSEAIKPLLVIMITKQ